MYICYISLPSPLSHFLVLSREPLYQLHLAISQFCQVTVVYIFLTFKILFSVYTQHITYLFIYTIVYSKAQMYFPYLSLVFTVTSSGSSILSFLFCTLLCSPVRLSACPFVIYLIGSILFNFLFSLKNGGFVGERIILILFPTLTPTAHLAVRFLVDTQSLANG